jgi:hypothetical protein
VTLYSNEIRNYIRSRDWPLRLQWEVAEYEEHLAFRFFRDNFNTFDGEEQRRIAMMVREVMEKVRGDGIPIYMEVMKSAHDRTFNDS